MIGGAWDGSLKRYVYDGGQLVQEHLWDVTEDQGSWVYTYNDIDRDYLRHQGGIRQREGTAASYNDFYLQQSGSSIEIKTQRDQASATIARAERTQSLNKIAGTTFTDISNLATSNSAIAMYGGGTSGGTAGFDGLVHLDSGGGYLPGAGGAINGGIITPYFGGGKPHYSRSGGRGKPPEYPGGVKCNCDDCRDFIKGTYGSHPDALAVACGCKEEILPMAWANDPCLSHGFDYSCLDLVCSSGFCGNPCCPSDVETRNLPPGEGDGEFTLPPREELDPGFDPKSEKIKYLETNWGGSIIDWARTLYRVSSEYSLCLCLCKDIDACTQIPILAAFAADIADDVFPSLYNCIDDPCDAFRHCYWSCTMASSPVVGADCAEEMGSIHEGMWGGGSGKDAEMDFINNKIGREIAAKGQDCFDGCLEAYNSYSLFWLKGGPTGHEHNPPWFEY
ncbi:MAG TPA: hypothetical protein VGB30_01040 [bacterium]